jgi:hypothetical protein
MAQKRPGLPVPELVKTGRSFLNWAASMGIRTGNGNWLENSVKKIELISKVKSITEQRKLAESLYDDLVDNQHSISDLLHLSFIHDNLGAQDQRILKIKLTDTLKGASTTRHELPTNTQPRDTMFELSVCARLNWRGFQAYLFDPNPDLIVRYRGTRIAIECKRVFSKKSIDYHIEKANEQLRDRNASQCSDFRVAYVDITRAFTDGKYHIFGKRDEVVPELAKKLDELGQHVMELLDHRQLTAIDAVVLVYQDYIDAVDDEYSLIGITQTLVVVNPLNMRKRRRKTIYLLRRLDPKGAIRLTTRITG